LVSYRTYGASGFGYRPSEVTDVEMDSHLSEVKTEFEHSQISGMARLMIPEKPEVAITGNECVCPNCGYAAIYFRTDLLYRA
jgi:hypothetical protein